MEHAQPTAASTTTQYEVNSLNEINTFAITFITVVVKQQFTVT
jgi:hypothetical protein